MSTNSLFILCFIKRRSDITEEQFYKHWKEVHAPKVAPWSQKHGIIGYTQIHTSKAVREILFAAPIPLAPLESDGAVIWQIPSFEKFLKAFEDPYYINVILPDEENFLDRSKGIATVTMGYAHQIVSGCQPLVDCGKDLSILEKWNNEQSGKST